MKYVVGVVLGMLSGFLIYMIAAIATAPAEPSGTFVAVTFLGGWVLSSVLLIPGARSVSKVFSRGFLMGAAEWLAVIPAGMVMAGSRSPRLPNREWRRPRRSRRGPCSVPEPGALHG